MSVLLSKYINLMQFIKNSSEFFSGARLVDSCGKINMLQYYFGKNSNEKD